MAKLSVANHPQAIIFDFDGTLADTFLMSLNIFYELAHRVPLPREDVTRLRAMTTRQMLREVHVSLLRAILLWRRGGKVMASRQRDITLFDGVVPMLRGLAEHYQLYILSSNRTDTITAVLERYSLEGTVHSICGDANPFNKTWALRRLIRRQSLNAGTVWYIGDQAHDVTSAHHAGLQAGAVTWGFNNLHLLQANSPELLAFSPDEITDYFIQVKT